MGLPRLPAPRQQRTSRTEMYQQKLAAVFLVTSPASAGEPPLALRVVEVVVVDIVVEVQQPERVPLRQLGHHGGHGAEAGDLGAGAAEGEAAAAGPALAGEEAAVHEASRQHGLAVAGGALRVARL